MANKISIVGLDGKTGGTKQLPKQFDEPVRTDLIKRAVLSVQSRARAPYGAAPDAGDRHAVDVSRRRRDYKGSYGKGISRVPRKVLNHRGGQFSWEGARAPGTKGGRRAHPPKASKDWERKLNEKENRKAIRSALAATVSKELVTKRGHHVPDSYPFLVADSLEHVSKTKVLRDALVKLGFGLELTRSTRNTKSKTGRAGLRGRKKQSKSVLIVTSANAPVMLAAHNMGGIDCVAVHELNAEFLAPGTHPGRLTLFTEGAIKQLEEKKLFI
jgi:large subunit ribosomal protein L4e